MRLGTFTLHPQAHNRRVTEMVRFVARVAYLGGGFAGWQRQREARTVQAVLEAALEDVFSRPVPIVAAGRTDAGVHAVGQVAHFDAPQRIPPAGLLAVLNTTLPRDVRVLSVAIAKPGFHARRSARAKRYRYRLAWGEPLEPWEALRTWELAARPDIAAMRDALAAVTGEHDFAAFALKGHSGTGQRGTVRLVIGARLTHRGRRVAIVVEGDGFLRGMVRRLVGAVVEVGRGAARPEWVRALVLDPRARPPAPTAPPHGLTLEVVRF